MAPPDPITCEELIVAYQLALDSFQFKYNIIFKKKTKIDMENQKTGKLGPEEGVLELPIPGGTWKPDNTLKGIYNQISRNLDNTLKEIRNLEPNRTWSQWPRGLTVPT